MMELNTVTKKYYASIDIMKFIMAFAIMFAHISSEKVIVHSVIKNLISVYNFGVPFFYASSGYLFFIKLKSTSSSKHRLIYIKFTKRILLMYTVWSAIYFCFVLTKWIQTDVPIEIIISYFHRALVFTTYATIWFLPSLWIGVSITYFLFKFDVDIKRIIIIAIGFYLIGSLDYSYSPLINDSLLDKLYDIYNKIFYTTRNGFFSGFPFVTIGAILAVRGSSFKKSNNLILSFLFASLFVGEAIFIKYKLGTNVDMGLMLFPAIYFIMSWLLQIELKPRRIYLHFRNLSMLIFLGQRLFITAIPSILPVSYLVIITQNPYFGLLIFASSIIIFSLIIENLSTKYSWLKILW